MNVIRDRAPGTAAEQIAIVMLPGAGDRAADLVKHGFVQALRQRALPVDAWVADARSDYYLDESVVSRIDQDVIRPARAEGYRQVWLMGISLGGLGALWYAREHGDLVCGIVLLAPFLGNRGLIAEIARAGGLRGWQPGGREPDDAEQALLGWLKHAAGSETQPRIHLGYGRDDRYAAASRLLEPQLPASRVICVTGGHDWPTWLKLWERFLDDGLFSTNAGPV